METCKIRDHIIQNALQAMDFKGKLEIEVKEKTTNQTNEQEFDRPRNFIVSSFTNDGPQIPKAEIEQIFEPFFTTKPIGEGTGLGLDFSLKIIRDHDGDITVDSQPGKTTFEVWLPVEKIDSNRMRTSLKG